MSEPEEAIRRARSEVERIRAQGGYAVEASRAAPAPGGEVGQDQLLEWALIHPDPAVAHSNRRWGAPLTALKRGLLRLLSQYHEELIAEQGRFNAGMVRYAGELEERTAALERRVVELERPPERP